MVSKGRHNPGRLVGEDHGRSKISEEDAIEILKLHGQFSCQEIADEFGVSKSTVSSIQSGTTWKHLSKRES